MKPYSLVLYNLIRFKIIHIFKCRSFSYSKIEMFNYDLRFLLKRTSKIYFDSNIVSDGHMTIIVGDNSYLHLGNHTYFNEDCMISCMKSVSIGDNCKFGPGVKIFDNNHVFNSKHGVLSDIKGKDIKIGNNCWIGANAVILSGTEIGDNCVIGAGCVVKGKVESSTIVKNQQNYILEKIR